jgi:HEAT repeat protein
MQDGQLDLFAAAGIRHEAPLPSPQPDRQPASAADLTDTALLAAIPDASLAACEALAGGAARRELVAAVPALEALCRRFKGFGLHHAIPEQTASLRALAAIGGADAVAAVRRIVVGEVVTGPGQREAVRAAAALRCVLPEHTAAALLRHADPEIRAQACRCTPRTAQVASLLASLLEDLNPGVATAAAKALGRMGHAEARPWLARLLRQNPDAELVEAVTPVADEECVVLLGRIARQDAALRDAALTALEAIETPRAAAVLAALGNPARRTVGPDSSGSRIPWG